MSTGGKNNTYKKKNQGGAAVITDTRFKSAQNDPKFRLKRRDESAVALDSRFSSLINSSKFTDEAPIDQYGRKTSKPSTQSNKLKNNFKLEKGGNKKEVDSRFAIPTNSHWKNDQDEDDEEEDVVPQKKQQQQPTKKVVSKPVVKKDNKPTTTATKKSNKKQAVVESESESESEQESEEEEEGNNGITQELVYGGFEYNEDTESSEDEAEGVEDSNFVEDVLEEDDIPRGDATKRIAVLNCDWDNIHSKDIYVILNSFVPKNGAIVSITIYPSDFGLQQMELEKRGPTMDIWKDPKQQGKQEDGVMDIKFDKKEDAESLDGSGFNLVSLRKYELSKLRYYYAVVIEDTANQLDLRFIPDDQEFKNEPRDTCTELPEAPPNLNFTTTVLKGTTVDFTWDVDKPRKKALTKNYAKDDFDEDEIKLYLAEPETSSEEEEDHPAPSRLALRNKYRSLLLGNDDEEEAKEKDDLQVTFKSAFDDGEDAADSDDEDGGLTVKFSDGEVDSSGDDDSDDESGDSDSNDDEDDSDDESGDSNEIAPQDEEWTKQMMMEDDDDEVDKTHQSITIRTDLHKIGKNLLREKEKRENSTVWNDYVDKRASKMSNKARDRRIRAEEEEAKAKEEAKKNKNRKNKKQTEEEKKSAAELELLMMDDKKGPKGFNKFMLAKQVKENTSDKKKKNSKKEDTKEDSFKVDTKDPRFQTLFTKSDFALDPTDPKFKMTNATKDILEEKKRRRDDKTSAPAVPEKKAKSDLTSFQEMAQNIKKKTESLKKK
eukprot:gene1153-1318_t